MKANNRVEVAMEQTEADLGMTKEALIELMSQLSPDEKGIIPIEIQSDIATCCGFVNASYYEETEYNLSLVQNILRALTEDWEAQNSSGLYPLDDEKMLYLSPAIK